MKPLPFGDPIVEMEKALRESPNTKKTLDEYRDELQHQVVDAVKKGSDITPFCDFCKNRKQRDP